MYIICREWKKYKIPKKREPKKKGLISISSPSVGFKFLSFVCVLNLGGGDGAGVERVVRRRRGLVGWSGSSLLILFSQSFHGRWWRSSPFLLFCFVYFYLFLSAFFATEWRISSVKIITVQKQNSIAPNFIPNPTDSRN